MLNEKAIAGLLEASPEKRYKSFLNMVADLEAIWLSSSTAQALHTVDMVTCMSLWPCQEICELMLPTGQEAMSIEIHDFLEQCTALDDTVSFMVFPTNKNSYKVTVQQLCLDIQEHLDELE